VEPAPRHGADVATGTETSEKLQKVLARAGLGSRRELERAIEAGRVTVDGQVAKIGDRVQGTEKIVFDGRPLRGADLVSPATRVLMYNKPEGVVCTRNDPDGRPTLFDDLPRLDHQRWVSVGRLDINTSGLVLLTNDGELAHGLMHPSSEVEREYRVRLFGDVDQATVDRLLKGVELDDGAARFTDISLDSESSGRNHWATVTLIEGRNREVRRLWESQGVQVSRLKRVRYGSIILPSRIKRGRWEEFDEVQVTQHAVAVHHGNLVDQHHLVGP
jgi:23S rRNA pseudouridine2605 synthase